MGTILSCLRSTYTSVFSIFGVGQQKDDNIHHPKEAHSVDDKTKDQTPFEIAIIGAGIGGLTFAIACLKNNVPFVLYEAAPKFSLVGAGVGFGPNALRAMGMIDPKLRAMYGNISSGNVTPNKNHVAMDVLYVEEGFGTCRGWNPAPFGAECYERTSAHRWDLLNILESMIPADKVRFNKRVKSMKNAEDVVSITFEDGEVAQASAVVGTDGVKGPVRSYVLGEQYPSEVRATYSGKYAYRATIPMEDALQILGSHAGDAKCFIGHNVNFMTYPISKGTQLNLVACKFVEDPWTCEQWTKTVTREEMVADFCDTTDRRLVKLLEWADPIQWALHHHMNTPTYCNDRICLLGDSAHAMTPHQASGAGQCMEDALVLSHLLGNVENERELPLAFQVYDIVRRPRAQRVVQTSQETGQIYSFTHPELREDMTKIVENLNTRFLWIWEHDLKGDLDRADHMFRKLVSQS